MRYAFAAQTVPAAGTFPLRELFSDPGEIDGRKLRWALVRDGTSVTWRTNSTTVGRLRKRRASFAETRMRSGRRRRSWG